MPQVKNEAGFFSQIVIIRAYKGMPQVKNEVGFFAQIFLWHLQRVRKI